MLVNASLIFKLAYKLAVPICIELLNGVASLFQVRSHLDEGQGNLLRFE